jgi:hypothetical protein
MEVSEKELEDIIFHASTDDLFERGIYLEGKHLGNYELANYGIAEIVTAHYWKQIAQKHSFIKIYEP